MASKKPEYMIFYVRGREADALEEGDLDVDDLVDKIMDGADLRDTLMAVGTKLAAPLTHSGEKREWVKEHRDLIDECGGDAEIAYDHFLAGRVDQYVHELEVEVVEGLIAGGSDEDEEDEDEDEDDDEDDKEEDGDDKG